MLYSPRVVTWYVCAIQDLAGQAIEAPQIYEIWFPSISQMNHSSLSNLAAMLIFDR
jgi:hypothetical protein